MILMNYQKEYSNLYGIDMWEHDYGQEQSLEDYIKDLTLAQMAQVYTLDIIASEKEVTLSEEEQKKVTEAAKTYLDGLDDAEQLLCVGYICFVAFSVLGGFQFQLVTICYQLTALVFQPLFGDFPLVF